MKRALAALALALGCDSGDESGGPCVDRKGAYQVSLVAESGNCPTPVSFIVTDGGAPGAEPGCTGTTQPSADNCSLILDVQCPSDDGGSFSTAGKIDWNADGSRGTGKLSFSATDPNGCQGLYRVTYTRL
jgi:hypothetical protein